MKKRNEGGDAPETAQQAPRPPVLPVMRVFKVTRRRIDDYLAAEEIPVYAHELQFSPQGALCFVEYVLVNGDVTMHMPRVFNKWLEVEETFKTTGTIN